MSKLGTFVALGVRGRRMIVNWSFNLVEFYVKMGKTNRNLMKECNCMKKVWTYFAIGCVVAIIGMFFSDICGDFFNGMDYGSACVLAHYG